jgi:hypothetical protein
MEQRRITTDNWDRYDTRHAVFRPAHMTAEALEAGYWRAYSQFYRWPAIVRAAWAKEDWFGRLRHIAYAGGWKKLEPVWGLIIRARQVGLTRPVLEAVLSGVGQRSRPARAGHGVSAPQNSAKALTTNP